MSRTQKEPTKQSSSESIAVSPILYQIIINLRLFDHFNIYFTFNLYMWVWWANGHMILKCCRNLRSKFGNSVLSWTCITKVKCRFHCICPFSKTDAGEEWEWCSGSSALAGHAQSPLFTPALLWCLVTHSRIPELGRRKQEDQKLVWVLGYMMSLRIHEALI